MSLGITPAAQAPGVTQPVLTRGLRLLEQQLGVELLERSARGASLTSYGLALVERASRVDEELQRARDELQQMQGRVSGQVAIACSPIPMMLFVPEAIGQFRQTFTEVEVRVSEAVYPEVMTEFRQGRIDFAIGPIPERGLGRDYKTIKLLDTELVVAVRRGHPKGKSRSIRAWACWAAATSCMKLLVGMETHHLELLLEEMKWVLVLHLIYKCGYLNLV